MVCVGIKEVDDKADWADGAGEAAEGLKSPIKAKVVVIWLVI